MITMELLLIRWVADNKDLTSLILWVKEEVLILIASLKAFLVEGAHMVQEKEVQAGALI